MFVLFLEDRWCEHLYKFRSSLLSVNFIQGNKNEAEVEEGVKIYFSRTIRKKLNEIITIYIYLCICIFNQSILANE